MGRNIRSVDSNLTPGSCISIVVLEHDVTQGKRPKSYLLSEARGYKAASGKSPYDVPWEMLSL